MDIRRSSPPGQLSPGDVAAESFWGSVSKPRFPQSLSYLVLRRHLPPEVPPAHLPFTPPLTQIKPCFSPTWSLTRVHCLGWENAHGTPKRKPLRKHCPQREGIRESFRQKIQEWKVVYFTEATGLWGHFIQLISSNDSHMPPVSLSLF